MREEYEVELIDYLRVLWWGKWIVLVCLFVALGVSAAFVFTRPTTYIGTSEIALHEYVTSAFLDMSAASMALDAAVSTALEGTERAIPDIVVSQPDGRGLLMIEARSPSSSGSREALSQAESELGKRLPAALGEELEHFAEKMRFRESTLLSQLDILRQRLEDERTTGDSLVSESLADEVAVLEAELARVQAALNTLGTVRPEDLLFLTTPEPPEIITTSANRKTTMAVAAFLGLMAGLLLAFFAHYLIQQRDRGKQTDC